jgi:signal transduction histidine kinase
MASARAARLARALAGFALVSMAVGVLAGLTVVIGTETLFPYLIHLALVPVSATAFAFLGALVASNRPRNAIGWLFLAASLCYGFETLALAGSLVLPADMQGPSRTLSWLAGWLWLPAVTLPTIYLFLLFPDGHLPSRRWRPVGWLAGVGLGGLLLAILLHPGPLPELGVENSNPLGLQSLVPALNTLVLISELMLLSGMLGSLAAFVQRYRQAGATDRHQLKWLAYALLLMLAAFFAAGLLWYLVPDDLIALQIGTNLTGLAVLATAVAAAIAILQHRLYDINVLINRTLVYSLLTASVAALYAIAVGVSSAVVRFNPLIPSLVLTVVITALLYKRVRAALQGLADKWTRLLFPRWLGAELGRAESPSDLAAESVPPAWMSWPDAWQRAASAAWMVVAVLALLIVAVSVPGYMMRIGLGPQDMTADITGARSMLIGFDIFGRLASLVSVTLSFGLAYLLFRRRKTHPMALFTSFYLLLFAAGLSGPAEAAARALGQPADFVLKLEGVLTAAPTLIILYIFPTGRFVPRWTRYLAVVALALTPTLFWLPAATSAVMGDSRYWPHLGIWTFLVMCGVFAQWRRYKLAATRLEQQQIRLAVGGLTAWIIMMLLLSIPYVLRAQIPPNQPIPWWAPASEALWFFSFVIPPAALAVAVLRYQLWDLNVIVNRTLVYAALTSGVVVLYVVSVGGLSLLFQARGGLLISLVATGLVAVLFQPLRNRVQLGVNRLLYGERDDPYAVLSSLGRRLETSLAADDLLPTIVETVAETLKLPFAAVALLVADEERIVARYGLPKGDQVKVDLQYRGERIGTLICGMRGPHEPFTDSEMRLLQDLGNQAGVVLHAARLTEDLRKSREQLVLAREEERRRLRRDLHDGLGPELASMTLKLDAARNLMNRDPDAADRLLVELKSQAQESLYNVRRLVYGLRPPALDELGLVPAVRESSAIRSAGSRPRITVNGPESLPPLPAAVEVAAYRVALEAVTNVVRHASAETCSVTFSVTDELELDVTDDGSGMTPESRAGVGLSSMRERTTELGGNLSIGPGPGGGTRLRARFPLTLTER